MFHLLPNCKTERNFIILLFMVSGVMSLPPGKTLTSDVSYEEILKLNISCGQFHSCIDRSIPDIEEFGCHCDPACVEMDNCCVDSGYRQSEQFYDADRVNCRSPFRRTAIRPPVVIVDKCRGGWGNEEVRNLCIGDPEALNDPFLLVPVSSSKTGISYRNFFCFVCNADVDADKPIFWDVKISNGLENAAKLRLPDFEYNKEIRSWTVRGSTVPVRIIPDIPHHLTTQKNGVRWCHTEAIVSTCSDRWSDDKIKRKCEAYMALVKVSKGDNSRNSKDVPSTVYRNPHCAICNFEAVSDIRCKRFVYNDKGDMSDGMSGVMLLGMFSFDPKRVKCAEGTMFSTHENKCRRYKY